MYQQVKNEKNLVRDINSKAILSVDKAGYEAHKRKNQNYVSRAEFDKLNNSVEQLSTVMNRLEDTMLKFLDTYK